MKPRRQRYDYDKIVEYIGINPGLSGAKLSKILNISLAITYQIMNDLISDNKIIMYKIPQKITKYKRSYKKSKKMINSYFINPLLLI